MGKIKAVVFDMDGVLIEAKEWHYEALNRALGLFGHTISRIDHLTAFDGLPTKKKLEMLSIDRGLPRGLHAMINDLKQVYTTEITHQKCKPTFSHEYALSKLKGLGYKLAVASNSIRPTVELMMEKSNLRPYLDVLLSNQDVANAKPHPEMYLAAATRLGLTPAECLVVEDNPHGVKAAEAAGCPVLVVQGVDEVHLANILSAVKATEGGRT
ncbi:HAD family hydrolase [Gemmata sp.]|uniref:HAD family hydrolase n=1 Tax=Gemmata sp. TaxID=1914242 RepID=UPI003F6F5033